MAFRIQPHMRLHEWVADEAGFFRDEGLDYEFEADGKMYGLAYSVCPSGIFVAPDSAYQQAARNTTRPCSSRANGNL